VEFGDEISPEVNGRVHALDHLLPPGVGGVVETVPSYRALLVYYDPLTATYAELIERLGRLAPAARTAPPAPSRLVELAACYGGDLGFDLEPAARRLGLTPAALARLHASGEYLVYFVGFTPGLPYMSGMPGGVTIPRLEQPRTRTPAGSVGIGGAQCCIYSVDSPGGFWVIARTPVPLYEPAAADPVLLRPGDRVRFRPIDRAEFDAIAAGVAEPSPPGIDHDAGVAASGRPARLRVSMIRVLDAGALTTVQDLGRRGALRYGIPESGPVDRDAFLLANRLVGNPAAAAALECTLIGPRLEFTADSVLAVTGAEMAVSVNDRPVPGWAAMPVRGGDVVRLGPARRGVRAYLAVAGGIDVPLALGSRSTYVRGRLGGYNGRALRRGDTLEIGTAAGPFRHRRVKPEAIPRYGGEVEVRVVLGPQAERFTAEGVATFLGASYEMLPQSDRMGARLGGPVIAHAGGHDIISDGVPLGGVQVVGDGQPIVLLVDRQSTGGYTKIATVCSFDVGRIGQVRPGEGVRFRGTSVEEAHAWLRAGQAALDRAIDEEAPR
jgi:KipI family sensor histidine kinase inhibitor